MPAILERTNEKLWLMAQQSEYRDFLKPFEGEMGAKAVSTLVNSSKNENIPL